MRSVSWLHLSDFHQGIGQHEWIWPTIKDQFFRDLAELREVTGPWDLILFTGDLTNRGTTAEFDALNESLLAIMSQLRKLESSPLLLAIPGNHDLVRPDALSPEVQAMRGWHNERELRDAFWTGKGSGLPYRDQITNVFVPYVAWYKTWQLAHPPSPGLVVESESGEMPGDFATSITNKDGLKVAIVGLNSAFLQLTSGNYKGKLELDPRQVARCGGDPPGWIRRHHASLLMTHHPIDWLHKNAQSRYKTIIAPPGLFTAHLFGHMHEGTTRTADIDGFAAQRLIQASSLFGMETWGKGEARNHGYSAGRIDIDGTKGTLRIWPRAMRTVREGFTELGPDTNFRLDRVGSMSMSFEPHIASTGQSSKSRSTTPQPAETGPQPPGSAYNARWYAEREHAHREALHYLQAGKPVVFWGPRGMGKTWVMKHVLELQSQISRCEIIDINMQLFRPAMGSLDELLCTIAQHIAQRLGLARDTVTARWRSVNTPTLKLTYLFEESFLRRDDSLVVLAIDQVDEILEFPIADAFFGMLRTWSENADRRAWSCLRIAMAASTLRLTRNINMSPFQGLSEPIELKDLEPVQVESLAERYRLDWKNAEISTLMRLVGGQPYLVRCAMYQAAAHRKKLDDILAPDSPTFVAHLEHCRRRIPDDPSLVNALAKMKQGRAVHLSDELADTLLRIGIIVHGGKRQYQLRYQLYKRL